MSLNQQTTNFYCSKDNAFAHYVKQKFMQQKDGTNIVNQVNSPLLNNGKRLLMNNKSSRSNKSITQLVQFFGSPQHKIQNGISETINQQNKNLQINSATPNVRYQQGELNLFSPSAISGVRVDSSDNTFSNNLSTKNQGGETKSIPSTQFRQYLSSSVDNHPILSEPDTIQLVLPSKYFNSRQSTQQLKQNTLSKKPKNSQVIKEIFSKNIDSSNQKNNNQTLANSIQDKIETSHILTKVLAHRGSDILTKYTPHKQSQSSQQIVKTIPNQYDFQTNLPNLSEIKQSFMSPQHSHKKGKIYKNYYVQKVSSMKNIKVHETQHLIERNFVSPFGDAQFDLVTPPYSNYSRQVEVSETKEGLSTSNFENQSPINSQKGEQSILGQTDQAKEQKNLQSKFYLQQYGQKLPPQEQYQFKNSINLSNILNNQAKSSHQLSVDNISPSNQSSSRAVELKSARLSHSPANEIAYDRFILNKQLKGADQKKLEAKIQNTSSVDTKQKQQNYQQNSKKKEQRSQISRAFSNYYEDSFTQLNSPDPQSGSKPQIVYLPPININQAGNLQVQKRNNIKSMSEIIPLTNRGKVGSQMKIDFPQIGQSTAHQITENMSQNSQENIYFERSKGRKQTENIKSLSEIGKMKNKFARQRTVDITNQIFNNELRYRAFKDDSEVQLSENQNYYQALMALKEEQENNGKQNKKQTTRSTQSKSVHKDQSLQDIQKEDTQTTQKKASNLKRKQTMMVQFEQELIESIRYLKQFIAEDDQMKIFIQTFCFLQVEEFCFLFGLFLDSIYDIPNEEATQGTNSQQRTKTKSNIQQSMNVITTQRIQNLPNNEGSSQAFIQGSMANLNTDVITGVNEQQILTQSIKLPAYGIDRIEQLLKQSFIKANVSDYEEKLQVFRDNRQSLLPENLLDEIGGRFFIDMIFVKFLEDLIQSKEFLRDCYEEQYQTILEKINSPEQKQKYIQIICEFLKENSDLIVPDFLKEKIKQFGIQLSSIDFFILKKKLYYFLLQQNLVITKNQILQIISRLNQLRQIICTDNLFIRNPSNLERHIFLSLKSFLVSSSFLKIVTTQSLMDLTNQIINFIIQKITPGAFINFLYSIVQEENLDKFINSLEFISRQAFEIYSYLSVEDRADLKTKFAVLRQKLGYEKHISQILPVPLQVILNNLKEWVQTQITDEPLPKEILLKNLENTELLEIIIEFSHPDINALNYHDSFAAFSYYSITKLQYQFWVRGFISILKQYKVPQPNINLAENFLTSIFPDRQSTKESNFKLNKASEQMYDQQFKTASQQKIQVNLPALNTEQ